MAHTIDHKEEEVRGIWRHIEEKSNKVLNTGKKVVPFAQQIWEGTKEFKDMRNPLNWGHNIGAVGARGLESFFTFDANNPKELSMELVEKAMGRKGIHYSMAKEVPGLKTVLVQAEDLAGQALTGIRKRANALIQGPQLQPALARAGGSNVAARSTGNVKSSNVFQSRKADLSQQLRTGTDTYIPTKEVLGELDESMKLFGQKMDRYNELKELRKPFIGLKSPEAKELAKKLGTKYIREGDVNTALRQARDAFSAAPRSAVKEYLGEMADLGYDAAKGKPGGKPRSGSGLHQHHIDANVEAYSRTRLLNKLGTTFKVQAQRYIADVYEMAPARARANMANIPADLHLGDLHPWLKSMGIETYWRDLWKANPRGISKQQMVTAIDNYFDEVVFPSLVKMDNLVKKSPTKISETHLPQNVVEAARKRLKELTNQPTYKSKFPEGSTAAEVMKEKRIEDLYIKGSEPKSKVWGTALE